MPSSNSRDIEQDKKIVRLEVLFEAIRNDLKDIKLSVSNHMTTQSKRINDLEKEMSKRWSRPEAVGLGLLMSIISALLIYIITK